MMFCFRGQETFERVLSNNDKDSRNKIKGKQIDNDEINECSAEGKTPDLQTSTKNSVHILQVDTIFSRDL